MYKVSFELETVTPLFMAGADGKTPERKLRPPSFKGILRFWWRVIQTEGRLPHLAEKEAGLFGGTGEYERKSNVSMRFPIKSELTTGTEYMLPHKPTERSRSPQQAIQAGQTFPCHLRFQQTKPNRRDENENWRDEIIDAFQIALILGGFGKRSRRGFGSIADRSTSKHQDTALGNGNPRMASPVVVSILKIEAQYHPIITKLSSHFKKPYPENYEEKQQVFIEEIVS